MARLIMLGTVASAFFSSTFILNRLMSLEGGHWAWTSSLRFGYMFIFLTLIVLITKGIHRISAIMDIFLQHWVFWTLAGSTGFGLFYSLLCLSASYAAGWIVATTWQTTILATPVVLMAYGRRVPTRGLLITAIIFLGIVCVNLEHAASATIKEVLLGTVPVMVAAFAYPIGNQMVWEATAGGRRFIPRIDHEVMKDSFARVLLLTIGSIPFWIVLLLVISPPAPSSGQLINTAMVALFSGVIATSLFLSARHLCRHPFEIAAVDASQSMEVIFSLLGEIVILHGVLPGFMGAGGIALTIFGMVAYTHIQSTALERG